MVDRRPLTEGLRTPAVDPQVERAFVHGERAVVPPVPPPAQAPPAARVPLSTRIRGEFAAALKRASLERQLGNVEPNTLQDILEEAIEPWLRSNGYLR